MTDYATLLNHNGLKATFQRTAILEHIEQHGHMSIDAIYEEVVKLYPSLSLATVYKNIILMVENSVLVEVPITGKKSKYELTKSDHIHLVCTECGEVEDKPHNSNADDIFNSMTQQENFSLSKQQINLYGVCVHCSNKMAS
ncbi:MAG: Ferric uptake regulation protein [uncultured Sulfurovum sp.]|uniref:Ferric uptake regulation protein n=1 Tax=uncultured Sulfurovum sp. TaxID=269237 RepID=A0A6S6UIT7_9BACT|nr:MAG: Ferric uptake regulation protein [uncultured Sulfurovum sp.]